MEQNEINMEDYQLLFACNYVLKDVLIYYQIITSCQHPKRDEMIHEITAFIAESQAGFLYCLECACIHYRSDVTGELKLLQVGNFAFLSFSPSALPAL